MRFELRVRPISLQLNIGTVANRPDGTWIGNLLLTSLRRLDRGGDLVASHYSHLSDAATEPNQAKTVFPEILSGPWNPMT